MYNTKPVVDFRGFLDNIPAMMRISQEVLSEKTFNELKSKTDIVNTYNEKKDIIFSYVTPKFD